MRDRAGPGLHLPTPEAASIAERIIAACDSVLVGGGAEASDDERMSVAVQIVADWIMTRGAGDISDVVVGLAKGLGSVLGRAHIPVQDNELHALFAASAARYHASSAAAVGRLGSVGHA